MVNEVEGMCRFFKKKIFYLLVRYSGMMFIMWGYSGSFDVVRSRFNRGVGE